MVGQTHSPWANLWGVVNTRLTEGSAVTDQDWARIDAASVGLSQVEASLLYAACVHACTCDENVYPLTLLSCTASEFSAKFLDNGRWMGFLADVLDEPSVHVRRDLLESARATRERDACLRRTQSELDAQLSKARLALRTERRRAFLRQRASLQRAFPAICWSDPNSTPRHEFRKMQLSKLSAEQRNAVLYVAPWLA